MNKFLIILNIYIILEAINYVGHLVQCEKIKKVKKHKKDKKSKKKIKLCAQIVKEDFINHIKNPHDTIDVGFNGRTRSLSKSNIHNSLVKKIYSPFHKTVKLSDHVYDIINKYENITNAKLPETSDEILDDENSIKVWYKPLPVILAFEAILLYSDMVMLSEGFEKITYENGLVIWYREGSENKLNTIVFLHAVAGGIAMQLQFIKKLQKTHNIVIPEIPGIAFGNRVFVPPTIREISNMIINFVINKNKSNLDLLNQLNQQYLQLIGHSFGGNIVSCIINNYVNKLEQNNIKIVNTTLVEPIIFLPSLFPVYNLLNAEINAEQLLDCVVNNKARMLSYFLIFRDIYAQYYAKCLTMVDVLMGTTEYEKNNSITVILAENDELYSAHECEHYLKSKKYNCNVIMLKNNGHGDFCFDEKIHKIVIDLIV